MCKIEILCPLVGELIWLHKGISLALRDSTKKISPDAKNVARKLLSFQFEQWG